MRSWSTGIPGPSHRADVLHDGVPAGRDVRAAVGRYRSRASEGRRVRFPVGRGMRRTMSPASLVFPTVNGTAISAHNYERDVIVPAAIRAGIMTAAPKARQKGEPKRDKATAVNFQAFRRTFATWMQRTDATHRRQRRRRARCHAAQQPRPDAESLHARDPGWCALGGRCTRPDAYRAEYRGNQVAGACPMRILLHNCTQVLSGKCP